MNHEFAIMIRIMPVPLIFRVDWQTVIVNYETKVVFPQVFDNLLCEEFEDIFYSDNIPLSFTSEIKHKLNLNHKTPIFTNSYR